MLLLAFLEVSPAVDHSCPGSQGVQSAVKSGSLARTVSPTSRAGEELRKPGRPPGASCGGRSWPSGRAQGSACVVPKRRSLRYPLPSATVFGFRHQTSGGSDSLSEGPGPNAHHPQQSRRKDLCNTPVKRRGPGAKVGRPDVEEKTSFRGLLHPETDGLGTRGTRAPPPSPRKYPAARRDPA